MKIPALIAVLFLSGCTFLEPIKEIVRDYETRISVAARDSSERVLCNVPLTTILKTFDAEKFVAWTIMCDHKLPGYQLVPVDEIP